MRVIGTAGHVDHGKSALVEALSGIHPDRLAEEKIREMTIDLGFAWFRLPNGEEVGVVDVPGHRDFIENMLAGVGGIDAVILVIAADEGVMPQTREHLAILNLLQVSCGVVALTKIDLVKDAEWLDLVEEDIRGVLRGTVFEGMPILRVSAKTKEGIEELKLALQTVLAELPPCLDRNKPRLPVDRVFTISGFGTIVTGTLTDGTLQVGEEVEILPRGYRARIRGLQTHKKKEETAFAGSRTAVNLSGVSVDQIRRGDVVVHPGDYVPTRRLDVYFHLLYDLQNPLKHNDVVKLFIWASEVIARVRLLGAEELSPGQEGWLQLELAHEIVAARGDHYILRRPSPAETLGGGIIVDAFPEKRHKRFSAEVINRLEALTHADLKEVLIHNIHGFGVCAVRDVLKRTNISEEAAFPVLNELISNGIVIQIEKRKPKEGQIHHDSLITTKSNWDQLLQRMMSWVENYHQTNPLRKGIPKEELKSRAKVSAQVFGVMMDDLISNGLLEDKGKWVSRAGFRVQFNAQQEIRIQRLLGQFSANPTTPPSVKDCMSIVGEEEYFALLDSNILVQVSEDVVFKREDFEKMSGEVRRMIQQNGSVTAAQVRDHFNTSRKYVLGLLEYLDSIGVTQREGDIRRLMK